MKETELVQFKIGAKEFQFTIEENKETIDSIRNIIVDVNAFIENKNKGMFTIENFAYFIFILATNLARVNTQNKQDTSFITEANEQKLAVEINEIIKKVSLLSASIKTEETI